MNPPPGRRMPLIAALFARMVLLLVVVVLAVGAVAFFAANERVDELYDGQLKIGAHVILALMSEELREVPAIGSPAPPPPPDFQLLSSEDRRAFRDYAEWRDYRIWRDGRVAMRSDGGPPVGAAPVSGGFSDIVATDGQRWRTYTLMVPDHRIAIQVGEPLALRMVLVRRIAFGAAAPLLLLIPLAAGLTWLSLRNGLSALRQLMGEIGRRSMRDLSAVPLEPWPRDLHPLIRAINRLFARIARALQHERSFFDNAAHQLRTPLAAVKLQSQLIARETDPVEREALTARLGESVDRAATMTDNLLTLARLEARGEPGEAPRGDLREEAVAAIADLAPLAARRGVEFAFEGPDQAPAGDPVLLRLIAANLIENALNHSPDGGEITVRVGADAAALTLSIADQGPGIPPGERRKVVQRFYRSQAGRENGAGLGLSIVSEAVRLLGGKLTLGDRPDGARGLCVTVDLPRRIDS